MFCLRQLTIVLMFAGLFLIGEAHQAVRARSANQREVIIPFTLTDQNNIVVKAKLNNTEELNLMFHTGASDVSLTEEAVRKIKSVRFTGSHQQEAWGGKANSRWSKGNLVEIGTVKRDNIVIWEDVNSGPGTDGKFGFDFFGKHIVEIDFDQRRLILHEQLPAKAKNYEHLAIENQNGNLMVQGSCLLEGKTYTNKFLIHSGYAGGILLDDAFAASTGVDGKIKITDESALKDSFGNTIKVKKGILPAFALGNAKLADVPAGFFAGQIGRQKMSVMGGAILKQFNLIFDIAKSDFYLQKRHA